MNARSIVLSAAVLLGLPPSSLAGPYGDDMAKCLVRSTTAADKSDLVRWMFAMMALHPDVRSLAVVSETDRHAMNRKLAALMERLLTESCRKESVDAVKYEGSGTIESSFKVLGEVAARELFANPAVTAGLSEFGKLVDSDKISKTLGINP
jgi:hypothetical protein